MIRSACYAFAILALILSCGTQTAHAQNSATFEVWRDADLFKLSTNTTDSVTFTLVGTVATITIEVREPFKTRPTRRLQITLPSFDGIGHYNPVTGASTYWENFTQTESCNCFDHSVNDVNITKYDSVTKEVGGTFTWKCQAFSTGSGDRIDSRIRNGVFEYGGEGKILITTSAQGDSISIGTLQADTVIGLTITAKKGTDLLGDVKIFINDKTADPSPFFVESGVTNANGIISYPINFRKDTPPGTYIISIVGEKTNFRKSDTTRVKVLYGNRYWHYKCGGVDILEFDAGEGKQWKPETDGSPIVKATGTITIGGVIKMDGTVRINTTEGQNRVFCDGVRMYIPNVNFTPLDITDLELTNLLVGDAFTLPDCDGIIKFGVDAGTKFLSKKLPGRVSIALKEFKLINRADAKGLSIKGKISLGNARMGCDAVTDTSGGFDLTEDPTVGLTIGVGITTAGWENFTFDAENISVTNSFCLKEFSVNADFVNEVYAVAGKVVFPCRGNDITLGGGVLFKNNPANPVDELQFDSLQASLELGNCKPMGQTPLCFKGLGFSTSGWSSAGGAGRAIRGSILLQSAEQVILDQVPWIQTIFGEPTIAEFEGVIEYRHPLIFTGAILTRLIKLEAISDDKPWQIEGSQSVTIDVNQSAAVNGNLKIGHLGLDDHFLTALGNVTLAWSPSVGISATLNGTVRIPAPGPKVLNNVLFGTALRFMQLSGLIPQTLGSASASVLLNEDAGFAISTSVNVSQHPTRFIRQMGVMDMAFKYINGTPSFTSRAGLPPPAVQPVGSKPLDGDVQGAAVPSQVIRVDNTVDRMFIMVIGAGTTAAPASTLTAPDGTVHTTTSADSVVNKESTPNGEMTRWALINPAVGDWTLTLTDPKAGDEVEVTVNRKERPFVISLTSADRTATITWDTAGTSDGDEVQFFIDADGLAFNGINIGKTTDAAGTFSYTLPANLTECAYSIYATRIAPGQPMVSSYASETIRLVGTSGVAAPVEVTAVSNQFGRTSVQWRMPVGSSVNGFLIYVTDASGKDSVYTTASTGTRFVMLDIDNHSNKKISIVAFNNEGNRACRTEALAITTGIEDTPFVTTGGGPSTKVF